jgi:Cys-tRNA(Pro)/Cys-tRNA(Cys) deacylase
MARTPAIAAAETAGIGFALHEYEHDRATEAYGLEAAEKLGVDPARLFKTLVVSVDGAEKAHAERATGYVAGGISPLGQRRRLPTHVDASALDHDTILVSAGRRGLQIELDPRDLVRLTGARVAPLSA